MVKTLPVCGTKPTPARTTSCAGSAVMSRPASTITAAFDADQADDGLQERALAGAVRADDGHDLARRDLDRHAVHDRQAAHVAGDHVAARRERSLRGSRRQFARGRRRARAGRRAPAPARRPRQITLPCAITTIGSQMLITMSMLCSMIRKRDAARCSATIRSISVSSSAGLTPAAGSSSRISLRLDHQHARQLQQLLLPARQLPGQLVGLARPSAQVSSTSIARSRMARSSRATRPAPHQLFQKRSPACFAGTSITFSSTVICGNGRGTWKVRARPWRKMRSGAQPVMRWPQKKISPAPRHQRAGDQVEQRGLAGAVRADQAGDAAGLHRQVDARHGDQAAEGLGDAAQFQQRRHRSARRGVQGGPAWRSAVISISTSAPATTSGQHTVVLAGRAAPSRSFSTAATAGTSPRSGT